MKKQKELWPPKGTIEISAQIRYHRVKKILLFRKYKYVQHKVKLQNIVSIIVEGDEISISHREPQKIMFTREFHIDTGTITKKGSLKSMLIILAKEGFLRINRNTIVRMAKIAKGNSKKDWCEICYWDYWLKMWYVGVEYPVGKKYQNIFQKFLEGKLQRLRKKAGRF